MASMSLMLARSNFVVQPGRGRSFLTEIRFNPVEKPKFLTILGRGGRREGVGVRAGLGAISSAVQRRRTRKGGRRRKNRQSQIQDVDGNSSSNEGELAKLPDNGTSLRTEYGDDVENENSDNETEESPLDQFHSDGTQPPIIPGASQYDHGKEREGSIQEHEDKIPGQQSAGSSFNNILLDAMQKETRSQFVDNLTLSASMQHFLGSTSLSHLQQRSSSGMVQEQSSSLALAETSEIIDPHVFVHSVNSASWYSSIHQVGNHHHTHRSKENHPKTVTGQLPAVQSPSLRGRLCSKSDSKEVGVQGRLRAARSKKLAKRKTKGHDVKMDKLMVRKTSAGAEQPPDVEMSLDISVVDAKAPEGVFEDGAHCMEAPTGVVNHSNGDIRASSSSEKVDIGGLAGISRLLQHAKPKQTNEYTTSLQSSVLQTVQNMDRKDVGMLAEDANVSCITSEDFLANGALSMALLSKVAAVLPKQVLKELSSKLTELPVKLIKEFPSKVAELPLKVTKELPAKVAELPVMVVKDVPTAAVEGSSQSLKNGVIVPVVETLPDVMVEQVGQPGEQDCATHTHTLVSALVTLKESQVTESVTLPVPEVMDAVTSTVSEVKDMVKSTVAEVTDSVASTAAEVAECETSVTISVSSAATQVSSTAPLQTDGNLPSFRTSDAPEFRGLQGIENVHVLQENLGILATIYDFYIFMLKRPLPQFTLGMFAAPILLSVLFTGLYLLDFQGLSLDETAHGVLESAPGDDTSRVLTMSWTLFQFFMFSLSLSTGLQPELVPVSPYTLVVANINALVAQLMFVFLSGAVFARLSQPSQPVRCSKVALMCPAFTQSRQTEDPSSTNILTARFVLVGPQPCELVDVKVDLTYKYNTVTRSGSFFRARCSLKLVRSEVAHLTYGMLVRHIVDETSPLYHRTLEMLDREDAVFTLSVIAVERTSMQCVFHVQHYCVSDADVIWDAEFEDLCLVNKKHERIYDHSKLSCWRAV